MYEIREIKWKHGHLSVYALQRFSHGKNDRSELKFFAHLPQTSLMGKHEKTDSFYFFYPVCGQFPQWNTSGTHKNTPNAPVFRPPRGQIFFQKLSETYHYIQMVLSDQVYNLWKTEVDQSHRK